MQIIDLSAIDDGLVTLNGSFTGSLPNTAHTVGVNPDSGFAYLGGPNFGNGGLLAVDLADPANPAIAGFWGGHYVHDTLVVTYDAGPYAGREIAFNFCGAAGVNIVDVTDKSNMQTVAIAHYPHLNYCHQGWLSADRRYLFVDDELDELQDPAVVSATTYVLDVSKLEKPEFVTSFTNGVCSIDHNLMVRGPHVYEANYTSGLRIYHAQNPLEAVEVAFFDTHPEGNAPVFDGLWSVFTGFPSGVVVVSDIHRGLFVLNYDCNDNGIDDSVDITENTSVDCDGHGVPDECEFRKPGDLNRDRTVNLWDYERFEPCLSGPKELPHNAKTCSYELPCCIHADVDRDGDIDLIDVWDLIGRFERN
jgi:choice-of-anchor B domain-containing protein